MNVEGTDDGVMSTASLHHLPTILHLKYYLKEINHILALDGAIYLTDFGRLKLPSSVLYFTYMNQDRDPYRFQLNPIVA